MSKKNIKIPLSIPVLAGNEWKYIKECLDFGWVSSCGSFVDKFEKAISKYTGAKYAVACVNGTCGLQIALEVAGVNKDDEVIVPTLTFIAPVNAIRYLGAEPVFMDCDSYMNLDPDKLDEFLRKECIKSVCGLKNKKSGKIIKAILPVHIFGNPCSMEEIVGIARKYGLKVVEDATESLGSFYTRGPYKGRFTGTIGDLGVYSFNGNKIITTGGGGMIVTNKKDLTKKIKYLINQAKDDSIKYIHNQVGYNFRLGNLQAALGVAQLERIEDFIKIKKSNFETYRKELRGVPGVALLDIPKGTRPNYWFYSLLVDEKVFGVRRDQLMRQLSEKGIEARPLWYLNHLQKPYKRNQAHKIERSIWFWKRVLNLPCSANLKEKDVKAIAQKIKTMRGKHEKN